MDRQNKFAAGALLGALLLGGTALYWMAAHSHSIAFLPARSPAKWIIYPTPADGPGFKNVELGTTFEREFNLDSVRNNISLAVCAFQKCKVTINGKPASSPDTTRDWKQPKQYDISGFLHPGTNTLSVTVSNDAALPAMWLAATGPGLVLISDEHWRASYAGAVWQPAQSAFQPLAVRKGNRLYLERSNWEELFARWRWFAGFLGLTVLALVLWRRFSRGSLSPGNPVGASSNSPAVSGQLGNRAGERLPWIVWGCLVLAWIFLWGNNLGYLPLIEGFDASDHLDYIDYILKRHALPLANEGFQMYQPPLYYLLAAGQLALLHVSPYEADGISALRIFGLACGIGAFTLTFLSLRLLFPGKYKPQVFGLLLMGLLPCNLYLCQFLTNEILVILLGAAVFYFSLRLLQNPKLSMAQHAGLGMLWGAALLAKTSAIVLPAVGVIVVGWNLSLKARRGYRDWATFLIIPAVFCLLLCGWHYARVTAHFGNPLIGNWDRRTGHTWWQQEGFRAAPYYLKFGACLARPYFSAYHSFADGVYSTLWGDGLWSGEIDGVMRPPWNYDLMGPGYLFALVPTLAILTGVFVLLAKFVKEPGPEGFLVLSLTLLLGWLLLYYSLKVPYYAATKAFYASAAVAAMCALGAAGWDWWVAKAGRFRSLLYLGLGVWALTAFSAFWIRHEAAHTQILIARGFANSGRHDLAANRLAKWLVQDPRNAEAAGLFSLELLQLGQIDDARRLAEQTLTWAEEDPECHLALGAILSRQRLWDQAIAQARRARELAVDNPLAAQRLAEWLDHTDRTEEQVSACREALRIYPTQARFHALLAAALARQGQIVQAIETYRLALRLDDEWAPALDGLARILASAPDPKCRDGAEAVRLATRACTGRGAVNARYLQTLAAAEAESGRFDEAVGTVRKSMEAARAASDKQTESASEQLLKLFEANQPYRTDK